MEIFFAAVTIGYVLLHLYLYRGLTRSISLDSDISDKSPTVSVIVAARNEQQNILRCINSLKELRYPEEKLEIILVNDRSDDSTLRIMQESTSGLSRFRVINSRDILHTNLKGKANAIDTAIELSRGELIMLTDADCTVPESWITCTVRHFKKDVAMVCGFTLIEHEKSLFDKLQCLDWIYLLTLASASCGMGKIMSCIGNNLSFTKNAYEKAGGYSAIDFSVTEDLALMRKINSLGEGRVIYPVDYGSLVMTAGCADIGELSSQKRRWFRGGTGINALGYITGFELYASAFMLLFGYFFLGVKLWLALSTAVYLSQILLISRTSIRMGMNHLFPLSPLFFIYLSVYGLLLPFSFVFGKKIKWKGRTF